MSLEVDASPVPSGSAAILAQQVRPAFASSGCPSCAPAATVSGNSMVRSQLLPQGSQGAFPLLACGLGGDAETPADLLEGQPLPVVPEHHVAMILVETIEGQHERGFVLPHSQVSARRRSGRGPIASRRRLEGYFAIDSPFAGRAVLAPVVRQKMGQNAPQLEPPFGLGLATKRREIALGTQKRLLDQV